MQFKTKLLVATVALAAASASQAQLYKAGLTGAAENPPVTTSGTGTAVVSLNTATDELRVKTVFSGLNGTTTAAHIHCCVALPTANAGVTTATPTFPGFPSGVKEGSFDATFNTGLATTWNAAAITANGGTPAGVEAFLTTGMNGGGAYLNIHSSTSPGGEIRGALTRFSFVPASNAYTAEVARALDSLEAGTGAVNQRLVNMAFSTTAEQRLDMLALLPLPAMAVTTQASDSLFADYDQIGNRFGGLRSGSEGGVWGKISDRDSQYSVTNRSADIDSDGWDALVGYDINLGEGTRVGATLGMSEDSFDYDGVMTGGNGELEGWRATAYGEQHFGDIFVDAMVSWADYDLDLTRNAGAGNLMTAGTDVSQLGARVAAGMQLSPNASMSFTPQVRLDWSKIKVDGYTEAGPGGMALNVRTHNADRARLSLGGQLDFNASATIKPYVRAFWGIEAEDDPSMTAANFAAGGNAFTAVDAGLGSDSYVVGFGINVLANEKFAGMVSYDKIDGDGYDADNIQMKAVWRF